MAIKGVVEYKRPRKINVVSVSITLILLTVGYAGYQFMPIFLGKQEAYRVLEETSSAFALTPGRFLKDEAKMKSLKNKMNSDLRLNGVSDPNMETWIESEDGKNYTFGVLYSAYFDWPFEMFERIEYVFEIQHEIVVTRTAS